MFGAKWVSTIIQTTASASFTTAELDRTRIWLISAYALKTAETSASSCIGVQIRCFIDELFVQLLPAGLVAGGSLGAIMTLLNEPG